MNINATTIRALEIAERILDKDQEDPDPDMQGWFSPMRVGVAPRTIAWCVAKGYFQRKVIFTKGRRRPITFYRLGSKGVDALANKPDQPEPEDDPIWKKYLKHEGAV